MKTRLSEKEKELLSGAAKNIGAAALAAGVALSDAIDAFATLCRSIAEAAPIIIKTNMTLDKSTSPTDEMLESVATGKELHFMRHYKKHRVRKKYRNRLTKRYYRQPERRTRE